MNTTFALGALLLLASLTTVAAEAPDGGPMPKNGGPECEFIEFDDEFPFVVVDLTCPPVPPPVAAAF